MGSVTNTSPAWEDSAGPIQRLGIRGWRNLSFRGYADYMQTPEFGEQLADLMVRAREHRIVLMCAEGVPWRCHRSLIADALVARGVVVEEIVSATGARVHSLTPFARISGGVVMYPPEAPPITPRGRP